MPRKKNSLKSHTGQTTSGHTRDVKVERIAKVTIYKRGDVYYLYYRQGGVSHRRRVEGNLAVARATAHKVLTALDECKPSPIAYSRTSPQKMVEGFLEGVAKVQQLALRTRDRYRAALDRFLDFCAVAQISNIDSVQEATVEDFVKWLRGQKRTRNGAVRGKRDVYQVGGVKFILSTCRTAFNWAGRHRMLPPFSQNPFAVFPIDKLRDAADKVEKRMLFTPEQEKAFFVSCNDWQRPIFAILARYGLRVGELTHLLIEDVDFVNDLFIVRSKSWMFWTVKTGRERRLPLLKESKEIFQAAIGCRQAGFVFLNEDFMTGRSGLAHSLSSPQAFKALAERTAAVALAENPDADEREQQRSVVAFCRTMGQIPEKRLRTEFMTLTRKIGCPEFTRVHSLRHLFSSRAQEAGINPLLVQDILGHTTLEMTRRYTHLGIEARKDALQRLPSVSGFADNQVGHGATPQET